MNFLAPSFLWAIPITLVPILIHFLQRRTPQKLLFSHIRWIEEVSQSLMARKKIHDLLLLIIRTLLILLLVLFFSRPVIQTGGFLKNQDDETLMILVDTSASMRATLSGQSVFDLGIEQLKGFLRKIPAIKVGVISYSNKVEKEFAPTKDFSKVISELDQLHPTYFPTDISSSINQAFSVLSSYKKNRKSILIVTDNAKDQWKNMKGKIETSADYDPDVQIIVWEVFEPKGNVGVTSAHIELTQAGVLKGEMTLNLNGKQPTESVWNFKLGERVVDQGQIPQDKKSPITIPLEAHWEGGGYYSGRLNVTADELSFDDSFFIAGRFPKGYNLLLIDGQYGVAPSDSETYYLKTALDSPRDPRIQVVDTFRPDQISFDLLQKYQVVVLANAIPSKEKCDVLKAWVKEGGSLFLSAGGNWGTQPKDYFDFFSFSGNIKSNEKVDGQKAAVAVSLGSQLNDFDWGQVTVTQHVKVNSDSATTTLLTLSSGDPLLMTKKLGKGVLSLLSTSLNRSWTNLPSKPSFSPLMREFLHSLADPNREQSTLMGFVDEPLAIKLPPDIRVTSLTTPDGHSMGVDVKEGVLSLNHLMAPGLYKVKTSQASQDFTVAINLRGLDEESNSTQLSEKELRTIFPQSSVRLIEPRGNVLEKSLVSFQGRDITKVLLWSVLILFLLETVLSWPGGLFSRAQK